jgi:flagellar protein FlaJ
MTLIISFIFFGLLVYSEILSWGSIWIPFVICGLTYFLFIKSPSSQSRDIQKEIDYELPFSTLHMAAIASSDIEPVRLLTIISESDEYKIVGKEIKKILIQVKLYGYDLVTSLRNVAGRTSNKKLSELFNGMATNISSGGSLKNYLEKKAESFLLDYKLERKRYIELSGTFMDVYISILIAAPLILMLLFIVMSVANLNVGGLSLSVLLFLTVGIVILFNIIFLVILNLKQPKL